MSTDVTEVLLAFAGTQDGVIGVDQASELGVTRRWLGNLVRRSILTRAASGVYVVRGAPASFRQSLHIGLLSLGESSWVSHDAAAVLHGFEGSPRVPEAEFTVLRESKGCRSPYRVHTTLSLPRIDRVEVDGFRCTSATRAVLDLAHARVPVRRLEQAIDSAVRRGLSSPTALAKRLGELRGRGRYGSPVLDQLLVDSGGHTKLEREFLALVRRAGLPRPSTQVVHSFEGKTIARVDFLFDPYDVVVEVSGQLGHSTPTDRDHDAQRRDELQDLGRTVYEYTWNHVKHQPAYVERTLTQRLHKAGWRR